MGKTIDNIVNFVKEVKDSATPRENFGIEGYQTFMDEIQKIDSSRAANKIKYGAIKIRDKNILYLSNEFDSRSDNVISEEINNYVGSVLSKSAIKLDLKRDTALYRMNRVDELKEESTKYLTKLDKIVEDCTLERYDLSLEVSEVNKRLSPLIEDYNNMKSDHISMRKNILTGKDKFMNVFYSIFKFKDKIKKVDKLSKEDNARLKYDIRSNKAEIKINKIETDRDKEILEIKTEKMEELELKRVAAKKEISKITSFNSRIEGMKSFYEKYLDRSIKLN